MTEEELSDYVSVADFQLYWERADERVASSFSRLHFGHHKSVLFDPSLSSLHAAKRSICAKMGYPLTKWGFGLTVLLEKICGKNFVDKLRDTCLFEADFNW